MGNFLDNSNKLFQRGYMNIELTNNTRTYIAGQKVTGIVHVDLKERFYSSKLTITLEGKEQVAFLESYKDWDKDDDEDKDNRRLKTYHEWHFGE